MIIETINGKDFYTRYYDNKEFDILLKKLEDLKLFSRINQIKKHDEFILKIKLDINNSLAYWGRELEVKFKNKEIVSTNLVEHENPSKKELENAIFATRYFLDEGLEKFDYDYINIIGLEG